MFYYIRYMAARPRPNSVEYGNSKTTTLLPSTKCTRPHFQGRTGCGGRPSGWHDSVTCQRLVDNLYCDNYMSPVTTDGRILFCMTDCSRFTSSKDVQLNYYASVIDWQVRHYVLCLSVRPFMCYRT